MPTTANPSWMPASGRHKVSMGTSLRRALKTRGGAAATPKRNNLPDRDFYSFRYNFKPSSIDPTKPGSIDVNIGKDNTSVMVEFAGSQLGERHIFVGSEQQAKEVDCVLIYDEETGTFTLEKLDSYMNLTHERKISSSNHSRSTPPSAPSTSTQPSTDLDFEAQLERDLLGVDDDADGELDRDAYIASLKQEDEEEEEEEEVQVVAPQPRRPSPKAKSARQAKAPAKSTPSRTPQSIQPTKHKPPVKTKGKPRTLEVEAEDLEFGQPARQAMSIQLSPTSPALALPGSSAATRLVLAPSVPPSHKPEPQFATDSENEWEEVQPNPTGQIVAVDVADISDGDDGEDEEEIDLNAFEEEMNQELNATEHVSSHPISLNQFAGGVAEASQDEDDYTTSEDSDDD